MTKTQAQESLESQVLNELSKLGITLRFKDPNRRESIEAEGLMAGIISVAGSKKNYLACVVLPKQITGRIEVEYNQSDIKEEYSIARFSTSERSTKIECNSPKYRVISIHHLPVPLDCPNFVY